MAHIQILNLSQTPLSLCVRHLPITPDSYLAFLTGYLLLYWPAATQVPFLGGLTTLSLMMTGWEYTRLGILRALTKPDNAPHTL